MAPYNTQVWDVLSDQDAVALVTGTARRVELAAKRVGSEAIARGTQDNASPSSRYQGACSQLLQPCVKGGPSKTCTIKRSGVECPMH